MEKERLVQALKQCQSIVGRDKFNSHGKEYKGLSFSAEWELIMGLLRDVELGTFKVLAMGEFKNGKSTILNALIGNRILPAKEIATTAVITIIMYGKNVENVKVFFHDEKQPEEISMKAFHEKYRLMPQDEGKIGEQEKIDRFSNVDYALMECLSPLCLDGVRFVDTPGLAESKRRTETTMKYLPYANTVLFVLNAIKIFSQREKDYIKNNFYHKGLKNVFFIINRVNQLVEGLEDIKEEVNFYLRDVFMDADGHVDEALMQKRIFYVDAFGALAAKQEGDTEKLAATGFPEFEACFSEFLTSEERDASAYTSTIQTLKSLHHKIIDVARDTQAAIQIPVDILEKKKILSDQILKEANEQIDAVQREFDITKAAVKLKIIESLWRYIIAMENRWEADCQKIENKISIKQILKLAVTQNEEKREKLMEPLAHELKEYMTKNFTDWSNGIDTLIEPDINLLMAKIQDCAVQVDMDIYHASQIFAGSIREEDIFISKPISKSQLLISCVLFDPSMIITGAANGGMKWGDFFRKSIAQCVIAWVIFSIFSGGLSWILFLLAETLHVGIEAERMNDQLLLSLKTVLFDRTKDAVTNQRASLEEEIENAFQKYQDQVSGKLRGIIEQESKRQSDILLQIKNKEMNIAEEMERYQEAEKLFAQALQGVTDVEN